MKQLLLVLFFLFTVNSFTQNYKQIKISVSNAQQAFQIAQSGIDLEGAVTGKDNSLTLFVSENEFEIVKQLGLNYQIIIDDWQTYYSQLPKLDDFQKSIIKNESKIDYNVDGFGFGSMGGYYTYSEIVANLDSMYSHYPNLVTQKYSIGASHQGRPIWAVKISDNPNTNENEPKAGYDALVHAREPQSMASMMYFMWYLLENYGTDPEVTYLVNNREMFFVPCFNPDGYEYNRQNNPNGGGMWRKNRRNNGDGSFGVDLNRNFGYQWGYDNVGSSPIPGDETYRGPFAFSEPEAAAIKNLAELHNYKTHFNMHSYQNAILYPWGYINLETPDSASFREFASDMCSYNGYDYGTSYQILGYPSNGSVRDWMYGEQSSKEKAFGYTIEIGGNSDGFWPSQSRIFPLAQGTLKPCLYQAWVAGDYVELVNPGFSEQYIDPGDVIDMFSTFKNKGLSTAYDLNIEISSLSTYINVISSTASFDSISARENRTLTTPLTFSVSSTAPVDETASILLTSYYNSTAIRTDTLTFTIGTPIFIFADTTNNPIELWTITSNPANPKWEATNLLYHSTPTSFTDSKTGNYANSATVTMTMTNPIDLSGYNNPRLTFWTRYDIESNWDYGQVEASTNNGISWIPLQGIYTEPGTGTFQPNGEPLYDGLRTSWVQETMDLQGLTSSQFKLRFELRSDNSINKDGWYVDDIGILIYGIVPVELTSFSANVVDGKTKLDWKTASELNNSGFDIEKSVVNTQSSVGEKKNWTKIGFVNGNGTSTEINNYSFIDDEMLSQKTYYRLKQIDFDGTFSYSGVVEVDVNVPLTFSLEQNYPNPFNPSTKIHFVIPNDVRNLTLKVYDVLGKEIATLINEQKPAGNYEVLFDGSKLNSGVYFYTLKAGNFQSTKKMILLK